MSQSSQNAAAEKLEQRKATIRWYAGIIQKEFDAIPYDGPEYECREEELFLSMDDGARLWTRVSKPDGLETFPVLINRSCYPLYLPVYDVYARELTRRGYGYVLQLCRGTGPSEGKWEPYVHERADGKVTIDWLDAQPWAESIGYFGASYLASTGWAIADILPPKVKGMLLMVYGTERFLSIYEKGLMRPDAVTGWAMTNAGREITADYMESCRYRPQSQVDEALWGGRLDWYQEMIHSVHITDPHWQSGWERELRAIPGRVKVPVCLVDGWYDNHLTSTLAAYSTLSEGAKAHSWLEVGCWNHLALPCTDWGDPQHLENGDVHHVLDWFDLLLKDKKIPEKKIRTYCIGEDRWYELPDWPSVPDGTLRFYPSAGGLLAERPGEGSGHFIYDPQDPCPSRGGEGLLSSIHEAGSRLQPEPGYRADVLSFLSEPLRQPLRIRGQMKVHLAVRTDAEDTAFTAKLMEVFPDGKAYNIRSSITTIAADLAEGACYTPGEETAVCVELWDIFWTLSPGSRLRLDISSSDFPQYVIHSNTAGPWADQAKTCTADQTIVFGEKSFVEIPVKQIGPVSAPIAAH